MIFVNVSSTALHSQDIKRCVPWVAAAKAEAPDIYVYKLLAGGYWWFGAGYRENAKIMSIGFPVLWGRSQSVPRCMFY